VVSLDTSFFSTNKTDGFDIAESNENTITLTCVVSEKIELKIFVCVIKGICTCIISIYGK
jgi:hypothetical protein